MSDHVQFSRGPIVGVCVHMHSLLHAHTALMLTLLELPPIFATDVSELRLHILGKGHEQTWF